MMKLTHTVTAEFLARFGRAIVAILVLVIFIRILGPEEFGSFVLFQALLALTTIFVDLGIGSAVQKRISAGRSSAFVTTAFAIEFGLLISVSLIIFSFSNYIDSYAGENVAWLIPWGVGAQQLARLTQHTLRGELRVAEAAGIQFLGETLILPIGYILVEAGMGVEGLILALIGSRGVSGMIGLVRWDQSATLPSIDAAQSLFHFAKYNFFSATLGGTIYTWLDTLLIGLFLSQSAVTAYEAAWRVGMGVSLISQSIGTTYFPQVSHWYEQKNIKAIESSLPNAITGSLLVVFPSIVGAILFGEIILRTLFGPEVITAVLALILILVGKIPESLNDVVSRTLLGLDKPQIPALASVVFVVVNTTLNLVLIPFIGITGAALATTTAFVINTGIVFYLLGEVINISVRWRDIGVCITGSFTMGVLLALIASVIPISGLIEILGMVILGAAIYFSTILVDPQLREMVKEQFSV